MKKIFYLFYLFTFSIFAMKQSNAPVKPSVVLLGDGVLAPDANSLPKSLQLIFPAFNILNYASPGLTSSQLNEQMTLWGNQQELFYGNYQIPENAIIFLGIGGHDIQNAFFSNSDIKPVLQNIYSNLNEIISKLNPYKRTIIIVLAYKPFVDSSLYNNLPNQDAALRIEAIMESIGQPIVKLARDNYLSIIDLANSFDPNNKNLYGELNRSSVLAASEIIVPLIRLVTVSNFFLGEKPQIYSKKDDEIRIVPNNDKNPWHIKTERDNDKQIEFENLKKEFKLTNAF